MLIGSSTTESTRSSLPCTVRERCAAPARAFKATSAFPLKATPLDHHSPSSPFSRCPTGAAHALDDRPLSVDGITSMCNGIAAPERVIRAHAGGLVTSAIEFGAWCGGVSPRCSRDTSSEPYCATHPGRVAAGPFRQRGDDCGEIDPISPQSSSAQACCLGAVPSSPRSSRTTRSDTFPEVS